MQNQIQCNYERFRIQLEVYMHISSITYIHIYIYPFPSGLKLPSSSLSLSTRAWINLRDLINFSSTVDSVASIFLYVHGDWSRRLWLTVCLTQNDLITQINKNNLINFFPLLYKSQLNNYRYYRKIVHVSFSIVSLGSN